ncbi:MAG: BON domain-containing protein [Rhizobiales bacterium]|nr:BON domain-containing protein [Hyphomicrobiales bacterium]
MASSKLTRTALMAALTVTAMGAVVSAAPRDVRPSAPARSPIVDLVSSESNSVPIPLGIGKSMVVDLSREVKDVLVADPKIANAVVRSARRAYLIGVAVGQTSIFFFDAQGQQIAGFDIAVKRDLNGIRAALAQAIRQARIRVEPLGADGIILTGTANSAAEAQQAYDITARLLGVGTSPITGSGEKIVNAITVRGRDQVMLKVTVAEMQRDVAKQLGVDLNGSFSYGTAVVNFNTDNPFSASGQPISDTAISAQGAINNVTGLPRIGATVRAMERAGVIRTLAEPNLSAISGENATFLAGGEFPIVSSVSCLPGTTQCTPSIEFKKFGVSLNFTPVVLSEGRISLKVVTEVSELSSEGSISQAGFTIPALKTRRADTTVELPSGGTLAMAGMIQEQTKQAINGVPGLMQVPILGTLFRSRDYINRQTELVVLVTPYVVRAVAQKELSRPDDGFADAPDPSSALLGRLNRIYGVAGSRPELRGGYRGNYGFILD